MDKSAEGPSQKDDQPKVEVSLGHWFNPFVNLDESYFKDALDWYAHIEVPFSVSEAGDFTVDLTWIDDKFFFGKDISGVVALNDRDQWLENINKLDFEKILGRRLLEIAIIFEKDMKGKDPPYGADSPYKVEVKTGTGNVYRNAIIGAGDLIDGD